MSRHVILVCGSISIMLFAGASLASPGPGAPATKKLAPVSQICPAKKPPNGVGMATGTPQAPAPIIRGHIARLDGTGTQIRFTDLETAVELQAVHYKGIASGPYVIPTEGEIKGIKVNGKDLSLKNGDLGSGCVELNTIGKVLVLFENSVLSESVTVVLTPEQLRKLK
jgi:hypothetical protein